jgi:serine/threonine-protein kinase
MEIDRGATVSQYLELPSPPAVSTGRLDVTSDPPGARVRLDGVAVGATPLRLPEVAAGQHAIMISNGDQVVQRTVAVAAGATASVFAALPKAAGPTAGWISTTSPVDLQIFEGGRLLGITSAAQLMLAEGRHDLEFVSESFEIRMRRSVDVVSGKTSNLVIALPNGVLSVNASPWADVSIDGRNIGLTPLGNIALPAGPHEVIWRHPQLGERRRVVSIKAQTPTRVSVDFNQ